MSVALSFDVRLSPVQVGPEVSIGLPLEGERNAVPVSDPVLRRVMYALFSDCFLGSPTEELIVRLGDPAFAHVARQWTGCIGDPFTGMKKTVRQLPRLATEYAGLFLLPGARNTLPFETCYRERRWSRPGQEPGPTFGLVALQVQRAYARWHMGAQPDLDEFPDHAGVELAFMAHLLALESSTAIQADRGTTAIVRAQQTFLQQHILEWFPAWLRAVRLRSQLPFYRCLAGLLSCFLRSEKVTIGLASSRLLAHAGPLRFE